MINSFVRILLIISLLFCTLISCNNYTLSEDQTKRFVRFYPASFYNEGNDLLQIPDGRYIILGKSAESSTSDSVIMLMMADEFGLEENTTSLHKENSGNDFGYKIIEVDDGYVIAGATQQDANSYGIIVKVTTTGEQIFNHTIGTFPQQEFKGITESSDEGFILTGYVKESTGDKQVYLVKTDPLGLTEWERVIGFNEYNDIGEAVVELNGRIIIAGSTDPVNTSSGNSRLLILNTNSEGKGMTECRISAEGDLAATDMLIDNDGNIIILGNQKNSISDLSSLYFVKIRLEGFSNEIITVLNATSIDFAESLHGESMVSTDDNSLAVCGWQEKGNDSNILFARITQDFNLQDIQIFGSSGYQSGSGICITSDGGYAITGGAELAGKITTALIKLGPDGKLH